MKYSESTRASTPACPRIRPTSFAEPEVFPEGLTVEEARFADDIRPPFKASRFIVAPGGRTPPDTHAVAECWFVASGEARLLYDDEVIALGQGDIIVFAPNKTHQAFNDGDRPFIVFSTWWGVDGQL